MHKDQGRRRNHAPRTAVAALMVATLVCGAAPTIAAAQVIPNAATSAPQPGDNPYNEQLVRLPPDQRAARLARFVGATCIGSDPFLMGVTKQGPAKGYAYWSLRCAGDKSYMIQVAPDGSVAAMDCLTLKQNGEGRECYKTF